MGNKYSNLYTRPADAPTGAVSYKGPLPERGQSLIAAAAKISGAVGLGDVLYLRRMAPGEALLGLDLTHSADSNITAADLVLRPTDGSADITLVAASAVLDGTAGTSVAFTALASPVVPDNGKTYDLCWIAGAAGAAADHLHLIRSVHTGA